MTGACLALSLVSGAAINLELEGGAGTGFLFVAFVSVIWSIILLPFVYMLKIHGNFLSSNELEPIKEDIKDIVVLRKRLVFLTGIVSICGVVSTVDDDVSSVILFGAGFIYSSLLLFSLKNTPENNKALGIIVLGIGNYLNMFLTYSISFLPKAFEGFYLVLPSVAGVVVTFLVMVRLWGVSLSREDLKSLVFYISVGAISFSLVMLGLQYTPIKLNVFSIVINSVIWWVCFTAALVNINNRANKQIKFVPAT